MFNWFKKKTSADEELKARLAKSLEGYEASKMDPDTTDTTFTDVEINGKMMRVPKVTAKSIEDLTLTEFDYDVTIVGIDKEKKDPWSMNPADNTQWHRAEKHGK